MRILVTTLALLAMGCSKTTWVKPNFTQQELNADSYVCERDMRQSYFGGGIAGQVDSGNFFKKCMISKGWTQTSGTPARSAR